ncbi:condensation domain-containing protein [Plantactinospora sp. KLBMP9567]|uniref:condensation domain-containing protein n=1 Tax=Plantactinospora sp. KLBMP9567 TaxID=3085900 RepID=UPI0029829130|nr:condensation domain-containing protein [Plantactinospora sp. KLBMP9567]MDW5324885.1 condensation domain-containing protein [Plantactinospora sp. KLBMP9567]
MAEPPARRGPLTWSQQLLWSVYQDVPVSRRHTMNLTSIVEIPPEIAISPAAVRGAFDGLVDRHETLRTTYGLDEAGEPVQVVQPPGPAPLLLCRAEAGGTIEELRQRVTGTGLDIEAEWPFFGAALLAGDRVVAIGLAAHHIAVDGWGMAALCRELRDRLGGSVTADPDPWQPLDQARFERSPRGRRLNRRSLAYWARELGRIPHQMFPLVDDEPRFHSAVLRCPELPTAVARLADRTGVSYPAVVLAAFVAVLARVSGHPRCALLTMWSNRRTPRSYPAVGCLFQPVLLSVEVSAESTLGQLVAATARAYATATAHGQFALDEMKELSAQVAQARGIGGFRTGVTFNFLPEDAPAPADDVRDAGAARPYECEVRPLEMSDAATDLALTVHPGSSQLRLVARADVLPADRVDRFLLDVRKLLLTAAEREVRLSELAAIGTLAPPRRSPDWVYLDHCWIDLRQVEAALRSHPAVTSATVFVDGPPPRAVLTAEITTDGRTPTPTPRDLALHVLHEARHGGPILAPARYTCRPGPPIGTRSSGQSPSPVPEPARGGGAPWRPGSAPAPDQAAARCALLAAVARYHPEVTPTLAASYLQQGGRLRRAVAVVRELRRLGYTGISAEVFAGPRRLADVATELHPSTADRYGGVESPLWRK